MEPIKLGASKGNLWDQLRYGAANIARATVKAPFEIFEALDSGAQKAAAAGLSLPATVGAAFDEEENNIGKKYLEEFSQQMESLKQADQRINTLGDYISEYAVEPMGRFTDKVFDTLQGDRNKVLYPDVVDNIASITGNLAVGMIPFTSLTLPQKGLTAVGLFKNSLEGAKVGAATGAVFGIGPSEDFDQYLQNLAFSTALGGALPSVALAADRGLSFAKNTSARIGQQFNRMAQDQLGQSMQIAKQPQNSQVTKMRRPVQTVQAEQVEGGRLPSRVKDIITEKILKYEAQSGRKISSQQKSFLEKEVQQNLVKINQRNARRQIAQQRFTEIKAQQDFREAETKRIGIAQQIDRIKNYLKDRPRKLSPSQKQKQIEKAIEKAERIKNKAIERERLRAGIKTQQALDAELQAADSLVKEIEIQKIEITDSEINAVYKGPKNTEAIKEQIRQEKQTELSSIKQRLESENKILDTKIKEVKKLIDLKDESFQKPNEEVLKDLQAQKQKNENEIHSIEKKMSKTLPVSKAEIETVAQKVAAEKEAIRKDLAEKKLQEQTTLKQQIETQAEGVVEQYYRNTGRRTNLENYLQKQQAELERVKNIQKGKVEEFARKKLGVEDVSEANLQNEIARLEKELEDAQIFQAEYLKGAASEAQYLAEDVEFFKEQGLTHVEIKDGKIKLAVSADDSSIRLPPIKVKKYGSEFAISRDEAGNITEISRPQTPEEIAYQKAEESILDGIDQLFGVSKDPVTKTEPAVEQVDKKGYKTDSKRAAIQKTFMPIQNAVDEISQKIGNKLAKLVAQSQSRPIVEAENLAKAVGYQYEGVFDITEFKKYLQELFPGGFEGKKTYMHVSEMPERLNAAQRDFLIKWHKHFGGEKITLPREYDQNEIFKKQSAEDQIEIKRKLEEEGLDSDLVQDQLFEKRKFEIVPDDYIEIALDPADQIITRLQRIAKQKSLEEFFQRPLDGKKGYKAMVDDLIVEEGLKGTPDGVQVKELLTRFFEPRPYTDNIFIRILNQFRYGTTLGGAASAIKQPLLGANRMILRNGIVRFFKGLQMVKDPVMQNHMVDVMGDIDKEGNRGIMKVIDNLNTGLFQMANKKGEMVPVMTTNYQYLVDESSKLLRGKGSASFKDYMSRRFGDKADYLIEMFAGFKNKKYTAFDPDVLETVVTVARDRGTLAMSKADKTFYSLSKNPLTAGAYKLGTFTIKDMNAISDGTLGEIQRGRWGEGLKNAVTWGILYGATNGLISDIVLRVGSGLQTTAEDLNLRDGIQSEDITNIPESFGRGFTRGGLQRTSEQIVSSYFSMLAFTDKYSTEKFFDSDSAIAGVFMNKLMPGVPGMIKTSTDSIKAMRGNPSNEFERATFNPLQVLNPDYNPSLKYLPPRILTETYYNIGDPLLRGSAAKVVEREVARLDYEKERTSTAQLEKQDNENKAEKKAGVPTEMIGTSEGKMLANKLQNKKYQEYLKDKRTFEKEDYIRGNSLISEFKGLSREEYQNRVKGLSIKDKRAYFAFLSREIDKAKFREHISDEEYYKLDNVIKNQAFGVK